MTERVERVGRAMFDGQPDHVREVWNAAGTQHNTAVLLRASVSATAVVR